MNTPHVDDKSERLLRRKEAAAYITDHFGLPVAASTLSKWAVVGGGPGFFKAGRYPLYAVETLDAWARAKIGRQLTSTAEYSRDSSLTAA